MKKFLAISMLTIMAWSSSGCSDNKEYSKAVEIHFQVFYPENHPFFADGKLVKAAENFHKLNPDIKVIIDYLESNEAMALTDNDTKLLESDKPQDIVPFAINKLGLAEQNGWLRDMSSLVSLSGPGQMDINQTILEAGTINGKLLLLPYAVNPRVILYNKDIFDKARIPYPQEEWTWEQFRDISKKIKPSIGSGSVLPYEPLTFDVLMASTGKGILSPSGDTSVGYLDSPEAVRTIQWLNQYYQDNVDELHKLSPKSNSDALDGFVDYSTGMILNSAFSKFYSFEGTNKDKLGIASLPYFEAGKRANAIGFSTIGISQKSQHPQEAWAFIEYLTLTNNEDSIQFSDTILTSAKVAEAAGQTTDPSKSVALKEMDYVVKSSSEANQFFTQAWNKELTAQFQELLRTEDHNIPARLHELALALDKELNRLKTIDEQLE
ncbi:ABC transporter substrate-binding protein [Cohnella abietis]|nr:extracellular solute-binding protein [Cohnella abietis]